MSPALDAACLTAMAKEPGDRFASMSAFAAKLLELMQSLSAQAEAIQAPSVLRQSDELMDAPTVVPADSPKARRTPPERPRAIQDELLVATLARTETQVSIYGSLLVVLLGLLSGCIVPRALMPEEVRQLSLATPHAWALDAYAQLLLNPEPNYGLVATACAVLAGFGLGFVGLAWRLLKLE